MIQVGKTVKSYYRKDGFIFVADHETKTVSVPQSVDPEDYPEEITTLLEAKKYYKQLTIE